MKRRVFRAVPEPLQTEIACRGASIRAPRSHFIEAGTGAGTEMRNIR
jgi:hypothetical protein